MKYFRKNDGITLIALVITIIIMLILATVSIRIAVNGGLFNYAGKAVKETQNAINAEKENIKELEYDISDEYYNEPVPEGTYYSIRNGEEKTYYETFKEAYEASVDNGGKYRGGTIVVEKDVTEDLTEPIIMNKTITINLKQNTMTRNQRMYLTGGTLTITGKDSSAIIGSGEDMVLLTVANDANLTIVGSPLIQSTSHPIFTAYADYHSEALGSDVTLPQSSGTVNLQGGYIISTERTGMRICGTGKVSINNTMVLTMLHSKNGLLISEGSSSDVVIDGNSIIANSIKNVDGTSGSSAISFSGTGNLTIKGNTIVTAGLYGSNAMSLHTPITLTIEDNASIYSQKNRTVLISANGTTLNINTRGIICSKTSSPPIGINTGVDNVKCNIQSGIFAGGISKPLEQVQAYMTNYPEEETQQNVEYYYLDSENFKTLKTVTAPNLYVVKIGVN